MTTVETYSVQGMTCGHCVSAVTSELGQITGVTDVAVDLDSGTAKVTSAEPLERSVVAAAVEEAGYVLA
jgi:copper chaperone